MGFSILFSGKFSNCSSTTFMVNHFHKNTSYNLPNGATALKLRVAYQGVSGAYGEAAVLKAYPTCEAVQCQQFKDVFRAAEMGVVEEAVVPIENSIAGSVEGNYDLLLRHGLYVVGEIYLRIDHCLLALPGVSVHHLRAVYSHPKALDQCKKSVAKLGVVALPADNTAVAAKMIASQGVRENGAIASARAAHLYGLHIIHHKFQDQTYNVTRFLKIARIPFIPQNDHICHKSSIVFILKEHTELHKALALFELRGIRLSKIESRPVLDERSIRFDGLEKESNRYIKHAYFIDFEASVMEPRVQSAITHLQELGTYVRILGCYPKDAIADLP